MPGPSDRLGLFLPGLSWIGQVEAKSGFIARKRETGGAPSQSKGATTISLIYLPRDAT
jgi:hypothetical protein